MTRRENGEKWRLDALIRVAGLAARYNAAMRRFGRWIFNGMAVVSLVLCVASAALWVRSFRGVDEMFVDREVFVHHGAGGGLSVGARYWIATSPGMITVYGEVAPLSEVWDGPQQNQATWHLGFARDKSLATGAFAANGLATSLVKRRFGFAYDSEFGGHFWLLGAPLWVIAGTAALIPFIRFARWFGYFGGDGKGICSSCGYNLTGNVSGVCPECGKPIANQGSSPGVGNGSVT